MIKTSANVPSKGGHAGNSCYDKSGQSPVPQKGSIIKTTVKGHMSKSRDSFYGGHPSDRTGIRTTAKKSI